MTKIICVALGIALASLGAGCGGSNRHGGIDVGDGEQRLESLLRDAGVTTESGPEGPPSGSFVAAWSAFKEFAAVEVDAGQLSSDALSDGLLFEFGLVDSGGPGSDAFDVSFTRQLATDDGDLQQVHLVAHFESGVFEDLRSRIVVSACADLARCAARCAFEGTTDLVGSSCTLTLGEPRQSGGRKLAASYVWSFDTGGSDLRDQRVSWIEYVERSPVFQELTSREVAPIGYEVWQESAE